MKVELLRVACLIRLINKFSTYLFTSFHRTENEKQSV